MRCSLFVLLILATSAFAQDSVKISGRIVNRVSDSVEVFYNDNKIAYYPKEFFARVDKNGNFSLAFPVPNGVYTQANLVNGNKEGAELILQPGDSLYMTADGKHFDSTVKFNGRGSNVANFIARHKVEKGVMNRYTVRVKSPINKGPDEFLKEIEREKKDELAFLAKHGAGLPPAFARYWSMYFQYYNYFFMQQYPQVHELIKYRRYTDTVPEINYTVLKEMPYAFNDSFLQLPSYLLYVTGAYEIKLKAAGYGLFTDPNGKQKLQDSVARLAYKRMPDATAEYYIGQSLYGKAKFQEPAKTDKELAAFKKRWPRSEYTQAIESQLAIGRRLAKGQPAPDFEFTTPDGKTKKLSDFRGKIVYLGFWASWCKQCLAEMVDENRIKPLIKNKPVEFVYVSINNDAEADRKVTEKHRIQGTFVQARNGWYSTEIQQYGVQSLPSYFLIDQDGNFATQNAPSPAQTTMLILEIGKLLK